MGYRQNILMCLLSQLSLLNERIHSYMSIELGLRMRVLILHNVKSILWMCMSLRN